MSIDIIMIEATLQVEKKELATDQQVLRETKDYCDNKIDILIGPLSTVGVAL